MSHPNTIGACLTSICHSFWMKTVKSSPKHYPLWVRNPVWYKHTWRLISCWRCFKRSLSSCNDCSLSFWHAWSGELAQALAPGAPPAGVRCKSWAVSNNKRLENVGKPKRKTKVDRFHLRACIKGLFQSPNSSRLRIRNTKNMSLRNRQLQDLLFFVWHRLLSISKW